MEFDFSVKSIMMHNCVVSRESEQAESVQLFILHISPQTYPASARNLNRLTMTVDVDVYDEDSEKVGL